MRWRALAACFIGAAALAAPAGAEERDTLLVTRNTDQPAGFAGADTPGERVFIVTADALTPDDTDGGGDLYERRGDSTTLVSVREPGAEGLGSGSARFRAISPDGALIVFTTNEQLVAEDTDNFDDVYVRTSGHTQLVSGGGTFFFGSPLFWDGASDDASHVFFHTSESLMPADTDGATDVYGWSDGTLELVSVDAAGANFAAEAEYYGASADGERVFFGTTEVLAPGDADTGRDVYERSNGATALVTTEGAQDVAARFVSSDGEHVFFESLEPIVAADGDDQKDVYEVTGGQTYLVSTGPNGGNGTYRSDFQRASRDGTRVYFTTTDHLVSADTDDADDIFQRYAGETTIESHGPVGGDSGNTIILEQINRAGTRMYFRTVEKLTADDQDFGVDSYMRFEGTTTRISVGAMNDNESTDTGFAGGTENADRLFFTSLQPMHPADDDATERDDIYERAGGVTNLVSTGPALATSPTRADAVFEGFSADGTKVWFTTTERLTDDDRDDALDVYESRVRPAPPVEPGAEAPEPEGQPGGGEPGPGGAPSTPPGPVSSEPISLEEPLPIELATSLRGGMLVHGGELTVPCRATDGRLRRCTVTIELTIGLAARRTERAGRARASRLRGLGAPAVSVIGRGAARFGGRGRRSARVRVRLTPHGVAAIRRAGGTRRVVVRLRARGVSGRTGALRRRARLVLARRFVVNGFRPGEATVPANRRAALRAIARDLAGTRSARCVGHADGSATRSFAERLGLMRAKALCRALAARGVHARLAAASAGKSRPRASNRTARGRALNRRVELVVLR